MVLGAIGCGRGPRLVARGLWFACGLWAAGFGLLVVGCGLWVVGCGLWVMGYGLWVVGCGLWVMDDGYGVWVWAVGYGFGAWGAAYGALAWGTDMGMGIDHSLHPGYVPVRGIPSLGCTYATFTVWL
jgi:hypothetical protein